MCIRDRGQTIYDLDADRFRWRQVLPMAISDREVGQGHPEQIAAREILLRGQIKIQSQQKGPRGGAILTADVARMNCEVLVADDGMIRNGKCGCRWHHKFGIRNGPCQHLQALRDAYLKRGESLGNDWYQNRMKWAGR